MVEVVFTVVDGGIMRFRPDYEFGIDLCKIQVVTHPNEYLHNGHNEIQGVNRSQESIPIKWLA